MDGMSKKVGNLVHESKKRIKGVYGGLIDKILPENNSANIDDIKNEIKKVNTDSFKDNPDVLKLIKDSSNPDELLSQQKADEVVKKQLPFWQWFNGKFMKRKTFSKIVGKDADGTQVLIMAFIVVIGGIKGISGFFGGGASGMIGNMVMGPLFAPFGLNASDAQTLLLAIRQGTITQAFAGCHSTGDVLKTALEYYTGVGPSVNTMINVVLLVCVGLLTLFVLHEYAKDEYGGVKNAFDAATGSVGQSIDKVSSYVKEKTENIDLNDIKGRFQTFLDGAIDEIKATAQNAEESFKDLLKGLEKNKKQHSI